MRLAAILFCFICPSLFGQGLLRKVSLVVHDSAEGYEIEQKFTLQLDSASPTFILKSLHFQGSLIKVNSVEGNHDIDYEVAMTNPLAIDVSTTDKLSELTVSYVVKTRRKSFYLPLFYTNLTATSSNDDFFTASINSNQMELLRLHFPSTQIDMEGATKDGILTFQLPALPSVLRMEKADNPTAGILFTTVVDLAVILVFIIISFLIWRKRKQLFYG